MNDLLQSESDKDFSMAITNVPLEPLLVILERDLFVKKQQADKLQIHQERTPLISNEAARKLVHQPLHIHFLEKDGEITVSKSLKREPKFLTERRLSEKETSKDGARLSETMPQMHFMPPPEGLGRGRSDSFSSQSSRESSPSSVGKLSVKSSSVNDLRPGDSFSSNRQRRSSKGSGYSTDGSTAR